MYFWRMTFREIEQFVLDSWLVLFVVDNFRLHRFLHQKTPRKSWLFCVSFLPIWIPLKRQSIFKFSGIPGSLLRPPDVRICNEITFKSACFWNAQKLLKKSWFYCVLKGPIKYASPGVVWGHAFSSNTLKRNPTLIPVRIEVSCCYTFFIVFEKLVFYVYHM